MNVKIDISFMRKLRRDDTITQRIIILSILRKLKYLLRNKTKLLSR